MTTDLTRLRQLLDKTALPWREGPDGAVFDANGYRVTLDDVTAGYPVWGSDEERALAIAAVNALPSLLATAENPIRVEFDDTPTRYRLRIYEGERLMMEREESPPYAALAEWARKARGVMRDAIAAFEDTDSVGGWHTAKQADALDALASLLAPVLSETETSAPDAVQHEVYVAGRTLVTEQPTAEAHARAMGWLRAFPGIADQPGAEQVYEAATLINVVEASVTLGTKLPWGEAYSRHIARRRAPALSAVLKGTRGTIEADGENAAELGERLVAEARRIVDDAPTGDAGGGDDGR